VTHIRLKHRTRTVEVTWRPEGLVVSIDGGPLDATIGGIDLDPAWTEEQERLDAEERGRRLDAMGDW
jgi:hypothetical protein